MTPFDFQPITRVIFGAGKVDSVGDLAREWGGTRALVVSDSGVIAAGHTGRGLDALRRAGLATEVFSGFHENPSTDEIDAGLTVAQAFQPDIILGLGGGSSMDCAKGINFLFTNGGRMQDYWGVGKATKPMLPSIAIPTTSGTGSETQSFALISDSKSHVKMACGDKKAAFRIAILDPALTVTQPARVTALTGIDAIAHALESYVTTKRNAASLAFSREAWQLLAPSFPEVLESPDSMGARAGMQLGACFAGMAIENSMLGAAHALANPLTAEYGVVHGQAVGMMLPYVIRFNASVAGGMYTELLEATGGAAGFPDPKHGAAGLADFVQNLVAKAGLATHLSQLKIPRERLPALAEFAAKQWTGNFNPRTVTAAEYLHVYESAY